jgi:electron transfer flavoprotein alpha subunit
MNTLQKAVLVITEQRNGIWNRMSFEALAAAQQLSASLSLHIAAAIVGSSADVSDLAPELAAKAEVLTLEHDLLALYTADAYVTALEQLIRQLNPGYIVFPHTYQVRDFAPALATRFRQSLISDVIALKSGPTFVRQLLQGKLSGDYTHTAPGPCFLSVQAGAFRADKLIPPAIPTEITPIEITLRPSQIRTHPGERFREAEQTVDLAAAPLIVSVGRGIREQDNIVLVEELAQALGAELAASRPICDAGWLPMERQVGSSGQTVTPKLYLAVGISGAIQHLVGMKGAKTIIAINKDENAPIFEIADYGVVGDLFEVVPALTKAILAAKS